MKKIAITIIFLALVIMANAQQKYQFQEVNHSVNKDVRYKLYPTVNMWTFLKLDTRTGTICQVQYSIEDDDSEVYLGSPLTSIDEETSENGRFELYPTQNSWTFLLLDQINGNVYHVQWGVNSKDRMIFKVKYLPFD